MSPSAAIKPMQRVRKTGSTAPSQRTDSIDIAEVRMAEGKLHLFVAIDRSSKFAFVELRVSGDFSAI